jgi:hypothetical protein
MVKISQLPQVDAPDGSEQAIVLKNGQAQRVALALVDGAVGTATRDIPLTVGSDFSDIATTMVGALVGSGNPSSNDRISLSAPAGVIGFAGQVQWSMSNVGTGILYAFRQHRDGRYEAIYRLAVSCVAGTNQIAVPDAPLLDATVRWGYQRLTGGTPLYQAQAGAVSPWLDASTVSAVGDLADVAGSAPVVGLPDLAQPCAATAGRSARRA